MKEMYPSCSCSLQQLLAYARTAFLDLGLQLDQIRYTEGPDKRSPKAALWMVFDLRTGDSALFAEQYSNEWRNELCRLLYERLSNKVESLLPGVPFWMDASVTFDQGCDVRPIGVPKAMVDRFGFVDVTCDNSVEYMSISSAIAQGILEKGSPIEDCCREHGGHDLLRHSGHIISPDPISLEVLKLFLRAKHIKSYLEIGAGVGLSGNVCRSAGMSDFHFVDLNCDVVNFVEQRFPGHITHSSAFDYTFDRRYDLVQLGIPYELLPGLLERKGSEISHWADCVAIQSACLTFFEWEHSWIMGGAAPRSWPWYKSSQSIRSYYPFVVEATYGFQSAIIASKYPLDDISCEMNVSGLKPTKFKSVS